MADDDEDELNGNGDGINNTQLNTLPQTELNQQSLKEILHNFTDINSMNSELKRVIPQLKLTIRSSIKVKFYLN